MFGALCRASRDERHREMPGDSLIPSPMAVFTHAITIDVPPGEVWPWLAQMGSGRSGWYSWDRIDNGRMPSAKRIVPELQHIAAGDILPALPDAETAFVVSEVVPERMLILTVPLRVGALQPSGDHKSVHEPPRASWALVLESKDAGHTRLISRGRISPQWLAADGGTGALSPGKPRLIERVYSLMAHMPRPLLLVVAGSGHYIMESRMLRGIKRRAEARARALGSGPKPRVREAISQR